MVGAVLWRNFRAFQIYGANTDVGKTIVSTALCKHLAEIRSEPVWYLKPIQTGDLFDNTHISSHAGKVNSEHLFRYPLPASPHLAATMPGFTPVSDRAIAKETYQALQRYASVGPGWAMVETAGGVLSPSPSKTVQADVYRPLRLPTVLVADSKLGGISATISAYESLKVRGYDMVSVVTFIDRETDNHKYFEEYFPSVVSIQPPPNYSSIGDREAMSEYYAGLANSQQLSQFSSTLEEFHSARVSAVSGMATEAEKHIWYPFSQHQEINRNTITTIDSAYGDSFQTLNSVKGLDNENLLASSFDGSASWWTQGLGHGNPSLALSAAHAAGRYGHVILANTVNEPALTLAKKMLDLVGNDRVNRVFFSDNGSTGIEVAIKMAMKAACDRYGWDVSDGNIGVIGLKRSYHGDTIGSLDCTEPSVYSKKVTWYTKRGFWFEYPTVLLKNNIWTVCVPESLETEFSSEEFESLDAVYDLASRDPTIYKSYIKKELTRLKNEGQKFGALLLEPVLLGAGGMRAVDPLFQNALVEAVREMEYGSGPLLQESGDWSGLPVIYDEVFTGLFRLGRASSASFIQAQPDISVHAKLLTGGLVPLCVTLASESIFKAFLSSDKADALLHGHSYTAHPVGCSVANDSLDQLQQIAHRDWKTSAMYSQWSQEFTARISTCDSVEGVFSLGSVLAIHLKDSNPGYTSTAAKAVHEVLRAVKDGSNVHTRPLGNVVYVMCGQKTQPQDLGELEAKIEKALL